MTSPKHKKKNRRHAEKLMQEAWEALAAGRHDLACRRSLQSIAEGFVNPRLWNDRGQILARCGCREDAIEALEKAVALAPGYAEAIRTLVPLERESGELETALDLQRQLVAKEAADREAAELLAALEAECAQPPPEIGDAPPDEPATATERSERYDWEGVRAELRDKGVARLPGLLTAAECQETIHLWPQDRFEHEVRVRSPERGLLDYRFFARPLPPLVQELRAELYMRLAPIANEWQELIHREERFPRSLDRLLWECARAGQHRTTPILLSYPEGGFNVPHRDHGRNVYFPFQLAVVLERGCNESGAGGEFLLADERRDRLRIRQRLPANRGDGIVFCTRDRLAEIGGAVALQPVLHGVEKTRGRRWVLGVSFHDEK